MLLTLGEMDILNCGKLWISLELMKLPIQTSLWKRRAIVVKPY